MGRPRQTRQTTNTYGFQQAPMTPAVEAVKNFQFQADPSIGYQYGAQRQRINEGLDDPLGPYTTPEMREMSRRNQLGSLDQSQAQALAEEAQRMNLLQDGQTTDYANFMKPQMVQTGGTTTQQQQGGVLGSVLGGAAQIGSAFLL